MADADSPQSSQRPVHGAALAQICRRWGRAGEAPCLHGEVARRMAERLGVVRLQPRTLVDGWSASGASQRLLEQAYAQARVIRVDPGAGAAAPWWSPRRWSAQSVPPGALDAQCTQLLWANMMLHMVSGPEQEMRQWHRALAVDGFLMFSTLGPGSLGGLRRLYAAEHWGPAHAPFVDMHDLGDMLAHAGFADPVMDQEIITLTWPDAAALLRELRALGGNADPQRHAGLRTPRWQTRLQRALEQLKGDDGRLRLDFEVVYGHAFKVAPKPRVAQRTTVDLQDMRAMVRSGRRTPGAHPRLR
jgi:malonyl-CoA O-methyltransferase